jgi:hypothetical protein
MSQPLYKYLSIDKNADGDIGSFNVLKDATLKFTNPLEFNDPFDCYPKIVFTGIHSYNPKLLKSVVFGAQMEQIHKDELKILVGAFNEKNQTQVKLKQARLADETYQIEIVDVVTT